jgi:hypothetical protein
MWRLRLYRARDSRRDNFCDNAAVVVGEQFLEKVDRTRFLASLKSRFDN